MSAGGAPRWEGAQQGRVRQPRQTRRRKRRLSADAKKRGLRAALRRRSALWRAYGRPGATVRFRSRVKAAAVCGSWPCCATSGTERAAAETPDPGTFAVLSARCGAWLPQGANAQKPGAYSVPRVSDGVLDARRRVDQRAGSRSASREAIARNFKRKASKQLLCWGRASWGAGMGFAPPGARRGAGKGHLFVMGWGRAQLQGAVLRAGQGATQWRQNAAQTVPVVRGQTPRLGSAWPLVRGCDGVAWTFFASRHQSAMPSVRVDPKFRAKK